MKQREKEIVLTETKNKVLENQEKCNSLVTILRDISLKEETNNILSNVPYVIKDNFSTQGILTTASSNTLKDYIPPFSATVFEKLEHAHAILVGKSVLDEFGMGGTGTTGHTGVVHNPWDLDSIAGGSSAGSAVVVADGVVPFALGTDTGDSVRKPAAYCGIVGYKPTYGMISRYGVIPFASSLDHVGVFSKYVYDAALVVNEIKGKDEHDMTSWDSSSIDLVSKIQESITGKKLFYIKELIEIENYENPNKEFQKILENFQDIIKKLESLGATVESVSIPNELLETLPSVYTCISSAEATSNLSNLTGIIFGPRGRGKNVTEMMIDHRTKGFSPLIKRRLIIGSYVLQKENQEKYFVNAQRIRNRIVTIFKELFSKYDGCILPCSSGPAPKIKDANDCMKKDLAILENHMVIGNFGGFPSITLPYGLVCSMPVGLNITSGGKEDEKLLNLANKIEEVLKFEGRVEK